MRKKNSSRRKPVLVYDVDNTLFDYQSYVFCKWGPPLEGMPEHLRKMYRKGFRIVLFTSRSDVEYDALVDYLTELDLIQYISRIQFGKPVAEIYIDDRGLRFDKDYNLLETQIEEMLHQLGRNI